MIRRCLSFEHQCFDNSTRSRTFIHLAFAYVQSVLSLSYILMEEQWSQLVNCIFCLKGASTVWIIFGSLRSGVLLTSLLLVVKFTAVPTLMPIDRKRKKHFAKSDLYGIEVLT